MTPAEMRATGKRIAEFIEREAITQNLDGTAMLTLVLTVAYGWAERAGLSPKKNPRPMFDHAAKVWDMLAREQRIDVVEEMPRSFWGGK